MSLETLMIILCAELEDPYDEYADWNTNADCCTWLQSNAHKVITCNSAGRVTSLTMGSPLEERPLPVWQRVGGGEFGVSLGNLTCLQKLNLEMPYCGGAIIPSTWANLVHLSNITMDIYLGGPLPGAIVKKWPLQWLVLTNNEMNGTIPKELCKSSLQTLNLTGNQFTGQIPSCLSRFPADSFAGGFTGSNPGLCGAPLPAC